MCHMKHRPLWWINSRLIVRKTQTRRIYFPTIPLRPCDSVSPTAQARLAMFQAALQRACVQRVTISYPDCVGHTDFRPQRVPGLIRRIIDQRHAQIQRSSVKNEYHKPSRHDIIHLMRQFASSDWWYLSGARRFSRLRQSAPTSANNVLRCMSSSLIKNAQCRKVYFRFTEHAYYFLHTTSFSTGWKHGTLTPESIFRVIYLSTKENAVQIISGNIKTKHVISNKNKPMLCGNGKLTKH